MASQWRGMTLSVRPRHRAPESRRDFVCRSPTKYQKEANMLRTLTCSSLLFFAPCAMAVGGQQLPPRLSVGDVIGGTAVVLVAPQGGTGTVTIELSIDPNFATVNSTTTLEVTDPLVPAKMTLSSLDSGTRYYVRATYAGAQRVSTFVTRGSTVSAPAATPGVRFGVSGDWRGDVGIFNSILNADERGLEFFVKLGDTIYADVPSPAVPGHAAQTLNEFRAKHVENYAPNHGIDPWGDLESAMPTFSMIDDHEVTNDFAGGAWSPTTGWYSEGELYRNGLQAFHEHNAIVQNTWSVPGDARVDGRPNLYRSFSWGSDAAVFMIDTRTFRDAELAPIANPFDPVQVLAFLQASFDPSRTMLGRPQLATLLNDLAAAQAAGVTWKFIMTPEPIQNFGPLAAQDRWEGYAAERAYLISQIARLGIKNVAFITADFHGTIVNDVTVPNPQNPAQQMFTGMFEIITGSVAYSAPAGPTFAQLGLATGAISAPQYSYYLTLPPAAQDAFVRNLLDGIVSQYGYSPTGIQDPSISVNFTSGGPLAAHSYGWTEFEVDAATKALTMTTWGCDWFTPEEAAANPAGIIARPITVRQRFTVQASLAPCPADLNGDRRVDGWDLGILLNAWGTSSPAGDVNHDGIVDGGDVAQLITTWGACAP